MIITKRSKVLILVALVASVSLMIIFTPARFAFTSLLSSYSGFTTLSLTKADFVSTSPFFTGKQWILYVSQGGMSQYATGTVTSTEIDEETGIPAERDFKIDITYGRQTCEYPIIFKERVRRPITKLNKVEWLCGWVPSTEEALQHCVSGFLIGQGKYYLELACFCIEEITYYPVGSIDSPQIHTMSTISVTNGVETFSKDFDTHADIRGYVGPYGDFRDNVYVKWDGYKPTAETCTSQDPYKSAYDGNWRIISDDFYRDHLTKYDVLIGKIGELPITRAGIQESYDGTNTAADTAMTPIPFGGIESPASLTEGVVIRELSTFISIPTYIFYVRADWLGIYQPIGVPQVTSAYMDTMISGEEEAKVKAIVKNIGDEREGFDAYITCPKPFRAGATQSQTIDPGMDYTFNLPIYCDTIAYAEQTCTVTASSVGGTDSRTFTAKCNPLGVCQANRWVCVGNEVYKCNPFGSADDLVDICEPDEVCGYRETGEAYCKSRVIACAQDGETPTIFKACCPGLTDINGVCSSRTPIPNEIILAIIIGSIIALLIGRLSKLGVEGYIIGALVGALAGYVVWFVLTNWLLIIILGLIGTGGFGIILWIIGPSTAFGIGYIIWQEIKEARKGGRK